MICFLFKFLFHDRKLTELFKFIDEKHVAIWGWSYGGFTSGMALATDSSHVFNCAASVAPVTDWTYYGNEKKYLRSNVSWCKERKNH